MEGPLRLSIGITGASGFVGQRVIQAVAHLGHRAIAFSRTPERQVRGCIQTRYFGPEKPGSGRHRIKMDVTGLDAIIHLAGESMFGLWTAAKRRRVMESRRQGTRLLVDSILDAGDKAPKVLVSASAIGYYGDTGDREIDESAPAGSGFLANVSKVWETEALRAETAGVRVVIVRIGLVLGRDGGAMSVLRPLFRMGLGAKLGRGQQWVSWVHVSDVARLILFSVENPNVRGVLNATSPSPVRNAEFTEALERKFNRKAWLTAPEPVLKAIMGDFSHALLDSQRVLPRRAEELGYHCQYKKL